MVRLWIITANIQMAQRQGKPIKMVAFLAELQKKYKVLSRLTDKEADLFQTEVITLLVDENENVDPNAYRQVQSEIGLEGFLIDILGTVLDRNPVAGQQEFKREMAQQSEELQKKSKQVNKRAKVVQRKQEEMNRAEQGLKNKIRQFSNQVQKEFLQRITSKEAEMKKRINSMMNILKTKEKLICDRREQICNKIEELALKEKNLVSLNKEKEKKMNKIAVLGHQQRGRQSHYQKQLKEVNSKLAQLGSELEKWKKKYKTTDMAYSKAKQDTLMIKRQKDEMQQQLHGLKSQIEQLKRRLNCKKEQTSEQRAREVNKKADNGQKEDGWNVRRPLIDMLEELEISEIDILEDKPQTIKVVPHAQQNIKISQLIKTRKTDSSHQNLNQNSDQQGDNSDQSSQEESSSHSDQDLPNCLRQQQANLTGRQLLDHIQTYDLQRDEQKVRLMRSGCLMAYMEKESYQINRKDLLIFLDYLLELIQQSSSCYEQSIEYLSAPKIVNFLQTAYLNYESNLELVEAVTLIISRISLLKGGIRLTKQFMKAVRVRVKMGEEKGEELLRANISCLLQNANEQDDD